jgi:two-component system, LytTR family, sensor kinase
MPVVSQAALGQDPHVGNRTASDRSLANSYPWFVVTGILLLIAWAFLVQSAAQSFIEMGPVAISYWRFFLVEPIGWLLWLLLLPFILITFQYFPLWNEKWKFFLPAQVFAAVLFSICHLYLYLICEALVLDSWPLSFYSVELKLNFFTLLQLAGQILSYSIIVLLVMGVNHYRRYQKLELEAAELERLIKEDRFENMMVELGPEFVMGTFRSIYEKIDLDLISADRLIAKLGNFLRILLQHNAEKMVPLTVELELLRNYFEIQRIRFSKNTTLQVLSEPETLSCLIPKLILFSIAETIVREHVCLEKVFSEVAVIIHRSHETLDIRITVQLASGIKNSEQISSIGRKLPEPYGRYCSIKLDPSDNKFSLSLFLPILLKEDQQKEIPSKNLEESILNPQIPSLDQCRSKIHLIDISNRHSDNALLRWSFIFLMYSLVASRFYIRATILNVDVGSHTVLGWYAWAFLTPLILYGFSKMDQHFSWKRLTVLLLITVVGWFLVTLFLSLVFPVGRNSSLLEVLVLRGINGSGFAFDFLAYMVLLGISFVRIYSEKLHQTELRNLQLEVQLVEAHLRVLRMQLQPHFLFNALHSLSELMYEDSRLAKGMTKHLEKFFGAAVENSGQLELTLEMELDLLKSYLEIQQMRFHDRLTVDICLAEDTLQDRVPNLILQPIIENAVKHGFSEKVEPGELEIRSKHENGMLVLEVKDNGPGMPPSQLGRFREGLGLANTRARLLQHYGSNFRLHLRNAEEGGLIVAIELPIVKESLLKVS